MTDQNATRGNVGAQPAGYRIFLASPGDVRDERELARVVIEQVRLERAFRERVNLEIIAWDQPGVAVAMEAGLTPQEAIKRGLPQPSQCDLVVVILWSRMGTPLPAEYTKPDGTAYRSGTEWEYRDAITAAQRSDRPKVWLYRRKQVPDLNLEDPEFDEKRRQWQQVKAFFETMQGQDGSLTGGVNPYQTPDEFRRQFEQHLRDRLTAVVEELQTPESTAAPLPAAEAKDLVRWLREPYPGLEAFIPAQAPIFFGRGSEVDQLLEVLRDTTTRFVAVVGASGSGKSSLVAAGLIPRLKAGALPDSDKWIDVTFKPGERGGDPFLALAYALKAAFDFSGQRESELAGDLQTEPQYLATYIGELFKGRSRDSELLLVVDQFEELFTLVGKEARRRFIELIEAFVGTPKVRVISTMRADFTPNAAEMPALARLFRGRGVFLLAAPGVLALAEMIRRPAQVAGLEIQDDLCERILTDTGTGSGALALMAYALHEIYERGQPSGQLTLHDYESLGGVAGAIQAQAEKALKRLGKTDDRALQALFSDLVEVNDQGVATRRRASLEQLRQDDAKTRLADALVHARILVTDSARADNPTLEVAHEAVFSSWRRLTGWVESHAGELRACRSLVRAAQDWQQAGAPRFRHLPDRATLKQYRKIRPACALGEQAAIVGGYLSAARRRQRLWSGFLALLVLVIGILGVDTWLRNREMNWNVLQIWARAQVGLYDGPDMVYIRGTDTPFLMGSSDCEPNSKTDECPQHPVTIQPFWMGKCEVTFDEYAVFILDTNRFELPHDENWGRRVRPVINVSWDEAKAYAEWLHKKTGQTGEPFRLPTEAEWEYAARAGSQALCWWGDDIRQDSKVWANCSDCGSEGAGKRTMPVGSFTASLFGLHDMHGNVWEWVEDDRHDTYDMAPDDGKAWIDNRRGTRRVMRGGSWFNGARGCRSAFCDSYWPAAAA